RGELLDLALANQLGPAIAQTGDVDPVVLLQGQHRRGAHAPPYGQVQAGIDNSAVGLSQGVLQRLTGGVVCRQSVLYHARDYLGSEPTGDLTAVLAAHAVGHQVKVPFGIDHEAIFVIGTQPLSRATADMDNQFRHATSPPLDSRPLVSVERYGAALPS